MKTSPTNKKIRELIGLVKEKKLIPRPEFQRRLVWSRDDKNHFLDSILRGYPFPEIYFADGEVDLETGEGTQLLVDGLQRVSTIIEYFECDPDLKLTTTPSYKELDTEKKKAFLQYDVAVRDLGSLSKDEIIDVFRRLNATKYSLLDIEVNNAIYAGKLKTFSDSIAQHEFFEKHKVFNALDYKRMGDLRFTLTIIITMIQGYFNRDEAFEEMLSRFNDDFPLQLEIQERIFKVIDFIDECGFTSKSRAWKKADLFTLFTEIDRHFLYSDKPLQPSETLDALEKLYQNGEASNITDPTVYSIYYKAALQASNDRINRVRRGLILECTIKNLGEAKTMEELQKQGLI